ncbi:MAG: DUF4129 domain-containing protein, partial [Victivallales bacterium]|nr:DUF4129 domain-containing protein [Victivallales bacterium]
LFAHPIRGPLLLAALGALGYWLRRRFRRRRQIRRTWELPLLREKLRHSYLRLEQALSRQYGIPREAGRTTGEWLEQLGEKQQLSDDVRTLIGQYRDLRFSETEPTTKQVMEFRNRVLALLRVIRRNRSQPR